MPVNHSCCLYFSDFFSLKYSCQVLSMVGQESNSCDGVLKTKTLSKCLHADGKKIYDSTELLVRSLT